MKIVSKCEDFNSTLLTEECERAIPTVVMVIVLLGITVPSVVGNGLVVIIMFKIQRMQSFMNWLLFNLAVADLSAAMCCLTVDLTYEVRYFYS